MKIAPVRNSRRAVHQPSAIVAALIILVAALPNFAQNVPTPPPAAVAERESMDFEGIHIVFPKGEVDVVEHLKPALRKFREERRRVIDGETKEMEQAFADSETRDKLRKPVAIWTARGGVSKQFDARWEAQAAKIQPLAEAWRQWSGDISELHLWRGKELAPFRARPDGGDDAEGFTYKFSQVAFGKNGSRFVVQPPFVPPLLGVDIALKLHTETKPLRLDIPLIYKPGESPEEIAKYGQSFLDELPQLLHKEYSSGPSGLVTVLLPWMFENMFLGEIEADFVERRTADETALADGLARFLLFAQILKQEGEEKVSKKFSKFFPFAINGWDTSDPTAILTTLEKLDPLAKVDRAQVTERIFARNLIAMTLVEIARKDNTQAPILHKFKKAGVIVPTGGFTMDSFVKAVDRAYGEGGFFQRALVEKKAATFQQLRQSITSPQDQPMDSPPPTAKTPVAVAGPPERLTSKFDGVTITYPPELKAGVEIVGPEYANIFSKAHKTIEALVKKGPTPVAAEVTNTDSASLRTYGIEPDAKLLHEFAVSLTSMQDGTQMARWAVSGDRIQIWIKEDLVNFLKGGGTLPDFTLAPDGENANWTPRLEFSGKDLVTAKTTASHSDLLAEIARRFDALPRPVYPIGLKRASMPKNPEDAQAVAAAIRASEKGILAVIRMINEDPQGASEQIASLTPQFGQEQSWFLAIHEVTEEAVVRDVIRSADRRWFCDGLANWVAMNEVERRFGPGKGAEAFAKSYDAAELRKHAAQVDLLAWPTVEDVEKGNRPDVENSLAHYYYATLVMQKACQDRGPDFVKKWLEEIRKTPLNRANGKSVLAAYQKLTGKRFEDIIAEVVK